MTAVARITAIDRFIKGLKEDGIYTDLQAACVMAGWDSLAGALTPLVGAAPTNSGLSNYDRGIGVGGDAANHIDTNRAGSADGQDDCHLSVFASSPATNTTSGGRAYIGVGGNGAGAKNIISRYVSPLEMTFRVNNSGGQEDDTNDAVGFIGASRSSPTTIQGRVSQADYLFTVSSDGTDSNDLHVFAINWATNSLVSNPTLAFYSIGSATDLAALDARVSTLMADLRAIEETGFDRDALAYIRAVEEADGAYLETDVKIAINNLVSGLKADDGLWDAIGSSCLLCGPRTLAGALVPLRGDAPTPNGFVSGDYSRTDGLKDAEGTSYLLAGIGYNEIAANDEHVSVHLTELPGDPQNLIGGGTVSPASYTRIGYFTSQQRYDVQTGSGVLVAAAFSLGFVGASRSSPTEFSHRQNRTTTTSLKNSSATRSSASTKFGVFCGNYSDIPASAPSTARISFFSIGASVDLAKLDTHISDYVTAIGAAL